MRGFRLSRPSGDGGPRRSIREDAEAEAAAELRRVLEGAGLPPEDTTEVLERTAARGPGGQGTAARGPAAERDAPRPAGLPAAERDEPRDEPRDAPRPAGLPAAERDAPPDGPPTRRVRKSPPGAAPPPSGPGAAASPPAAAAGRASRSGRR